MTTHVYPIVGSYFRPPAKALLDALPVGARLFIRPDPYGGRCNVEHSDPTALSVWLDPKAIPENAELESKLAGYGFTTAELKALDELHIGYIPKDFAAELNRTFGLQPDGPDIEAEFTVSSRGAPRVSFEL